MKVKNVKCKRQFALALLLITPVAADESVLYNQAPPKDAVFVRLLGNPGTTALEFNGHRIALPDGTQTAYAAISAQDLGLSEAGTFHSLLLDEYGNLRAIEEPKERPNNKVHLYLINADADPVRLIVPGREIEVIAGTEQMAIGTRSVNPIRTALAIQQVADEGILATFDVSLNRGQNITFLLQDGEVSLIENRLGPVIEPTG